MSIKIEFSTREYQEAHGRLPHGYRYGWTFRVDGAPDNEIMYAPLSTYRDAKKWAAAQVRALAAFAGLSGTVVIKVCPHHPTGADDPR